MRWALVWDPAVRCYAWRLTGSRVRQIIVCPAYPAGAVWFRCYGSIPGDLRHAWS